MGGSYSHGDRVTIERNELEREAFNVVHISEDAMNRLTGQKGDPKSGNQVELENILREQNALVHRLKEDLSLNQRELRSLREKLDSVQSGQIAARSAPVVEGNDKLKQVDQYWAAKLADFNKTQEGILKESADQFKESVDRVNKQFVKSTCHTACAGVEGQVLQCYLENPKTTLNCSGLAKTYLECVEQYRAELLAKQI